jgi:SulP family sulfate permease
MPSLPAISFEKVLELLPSAFVIAFLASVESLLSAMVADRMIGGHHRPNAEVLAQGFANIGSALFVGLPATGAIARTATNVRAGGPPHVSYRSCADHLAGRASGAPPLRATLRCQHLPDCLSSRPEI